MYGAFQIAFMSSSFKILVMNQILGARMNKEKQILAC